MYQDNKIQNEYIIIRTCETEKRPNQAQTIGRNKLYYLQEMPLLEEKEVDRQFLDVWSKELNVA